MSALPNYLPPVEPEEFDPAVEAGLELEEAAKRLGLEEPILQRLRLPEREIRVHLPETAFRVQHSTALGPSLGAVALRPDVSLGTLRAEAMAQTWQSALLDLPMGGSAGAILCDPQKLNERALKLLGQRYAASLGPILGLTKDLLMPGVGCHEMVAGWMSRRVEAGTMLSRPAVAQGVVALLRRILEERRLKLAEQRIAIQGFGFDGRATAELLYESGARIVALSDISGALYRDAGLHVPAIAEYASQHHRLLGCAEGEAVSNLELLECPCDVLILAAAPRQVNTRVAGRIVASIVLEVVDHAIGLPASKILSDRDRLVVPAMLARGGAGEASFQEWLERARGVIVPPIYDGSRLLRAWEETQSSVRFFKVSVKQGAMLVALGRLAAALRLD